jgi:predicted  nucleic acid-binding Zn-ribbon protein
MTHEHAEVEGDTTEYILSLMENAIDGLKEDIEDLEEAEHDLDSVAEQIMQAADSSSPEPKEEAIDRINAVERHVWQVHNRVEKAAKVTEKVEKALEKEKDILKQELTS